MNYRKLVILFLGILAVFFASEPLLNAFQKLDGWKLAAYTIQYNPLQGGEPFPLACTQKLDAHSRDFLSLQGTLQILQEKISTSAKTASMYLITGQIACLVDKKEQAKKDFEVVKGLRPNDLFSSLQLISLADEAGDQQSIEKELKESLFSAKDIVQFAVNSINVHDSENALKWCQRATLMDPKLDTIWSTWNSIGTQYEIEENWTKALNVFQLALSTQEKTGVDRYRATFYFHIAQDLIKRDAPQKNEEAIRYYNLAIADGRFINAQEDSSVYVSRGNWYRERKSIYTASVYLADYRKAIELDPTSINAFLLVGVVYLQDLKDIPAAEVNFREAIIRFPDNSYGYYYLGNALSQKGDWAGALAAYLQARMLKPELTDLSRLIQAAQKKMGK